MAARQLPPGRGAAPADPRRRAAQLLRAPAQARSAAAGRPAARLRHRLGLRGAHRQRAQPGAVHRFPQCLPGHRRAHARRAVGAADHAARGAAGEPAARGREHRRKQGGARGRACGLGRGRDALRRTTSTCSTARCKAAACRTATSPSCGSACRSSTATTRRRCVKWTEQHCPNGPALIGEAQTAQAAANLTVGNIITTLRMIGQVEWADLIEPVSRSLRVLRELPSFARESELTRQQITHAMEQVARTSAPAGARGRASRGAPGPRCGRRRAPRTKTTRRRWSRAERTAGYYLFGQGRSGARAPRWRRRTAAAPRASLPRLSAPRAWRLPLYVLAVLAGTALLLAHCGPRAAPQRLARRRHGRRRSRSCCSPGRCPKRCIALVHRIVAESTRVQPLPRLDFADRHSARRTACWSSIPAHAEFASGQRAARAPARTALARQPRRRTRSSRC